MEETGEKQKKQQRETQKRASAGVGFVLEGGAMRGIYTAGVLDVLMEQGILPDGILGVSAGAIHGASMVSGQRGRNIRYYKKYCRDRRFMSFWSLLTTGSLVGKKFCYEDLPLRLDPFDFDAFAQSPVAFYAVCTNVETGRAEYLSCRDMRTGMDILRASASMPFVSPIVEVDGKKLLDGGVADSIPIAAARRMGYRKNLVVLTQTRDFVKQPQKLGVQALMYRRYPELLKSIARRHRNYNRSRELAFELEKRGEALVLCPSEDLHIGRMEKNPERIQMMYELGCEDTRKRLEEIRAFVSQGRKSR